MAFARRILETAKPPGGEATAVSTAPMVRLGWNVTSAGNEVAIEQFDPDGSYTERIVSGESVDDVIAQLPADSVLMADGPVPDAARATIKQARGSDLPSSLDFLLGLRAAVSEVSLLQTPGTSVRLELGRVDPDEALSVSVLKLDGIGDSIAVRHSDGSLMLVDTGLGADAIQKLLDHYDGKVPPIRLLVTHRDADHMGGLKLMLEDPRFKLIEILIGQSRAAETKLAKDVSALLVGQNRYRQVQNASSSLRHYMLSEFAAEAPYLVDPPSKAVNVHKWRVVRAADSYMDFFQLVNPTTENQAGIVIKVCRRGRCVLLTDDAHPRTLRALTEAHAAGEIDLSSGVVKWPHHVWFPGPSAAGDEAALRAFLRCVDPHVVVFSNSGHPTHPANIEKARALIREELGESVRSFATIEEGTVQLIAYLYGSSSELLH
jgi:beta-lactamase superfamily II metal-dependent hydrolase